MIHVKRGGRYAAPFVICGKIVRWKHCEISGYSERKALWSQRMQCEESLVVSANAE